MRTICAFGLSKVFSYTICFLLLATLPVLGASDGKKKTNLGDARRLLTVGDAIETTQVLSVYGSDQVLISPNGKRFLVVLQRGDIARNGSWVELVSGLTTSIQSAGAHAVAKLFTKSTAETGQLIKNVRWLDDSEHVAFLWDEGHGTQQVVEINVLTGRLDILTHHSTPIVDYDISRDGNTIIFTAQARRDSGKVSELRRTGFAVAKQPIWALLKNDVDGWESWRHYETFVLSRGESRERRIEEPFRTWSTTPELLRLSPDARYALAVRPADNVPLDWNNYTEHVFRDTYLPTARRDPEAPNWIRQFVLIDIKNATWRPLWNAPTEAHGQIIWSSDSRSVVIGPTFLPTATADATGLSGRAVAEVDVATGRFRQVPLPNDIPDLGFKPLAWVNGILELTQTRTLLEEPRVLRFGRFEERWRPVDDEHEKQKSSPAVDIKIRQDLNSPPALYAIDGETGHERLLRDFNPQLKSVTLGRVELVHWNATDGRPWSGLLYYPVHYNPGRRFPFVIQTHGYSAKDFSLDGAFATAFAAQPLANRDTAVLQVGGPDIGGRSVSMTRNESGVFMAGIEGAIAHFSAMGLVDEGNVGIIGFSWTVFSVEYVLTHSKAKFAAAEVADGIDGGYFQYVLADNAQRPFQEAEKGEAPFGKGLAAWMSEAPGFNADKIQAPLRFEIDSGPISEILLHWEVFTHLRYLRKPVELFVIPDIQHGAHVLQNPVQRLASQGASVDWFCFWLKGEEDPDPAKAEQYRRWRELRKLQEQKVTKPEAQWSN